MNGDYDINDVKLQKQNFLIKEIIEKGYSKELFGEYMSSLKSKLLSSKKMGQI